MPKYRVRDADTYGHAVGILLLDYRGPFIPGDVGNATTYGFPVIFKLVKGLTLDRVLAGDVACEAAIVEAARELESHGVRGISSDCGFLIQYQEAVKKAVKVPVFMSSLLQEFRSSRRRSPTVPGRMHHRDPPQARQSGARTRRRQERDQRGDQGHGGSAAFQGGHS